MTKTKEPIEEQREPLQGQTTFPGFEDQTPPAEAIEKAARDISFQMDYIRDPEDALAAWGAPADFFSGFLTARFNRLVKQAAEITGADPEQIRDKDKRTEEQAKLLTEIAGRETLSRLDKFLKSLYHDALVSLFPLQHEKTDAIYSESIEQDVVKEQAVIYFFAVHEDIKPLDEGTLTKKQREELTATFHRLFDFYRDQAAQIGTENIRYGETLSAFIWHENPAQSAAESIIKKVPLLQSIRPAAHTMPNSLLMNSLQIDGAIETTADPQGIRLEIFPAKGRKKETATFAMVTYDPGDSGVTMTETKLSEYERQISDAIVSLWIESVKENVPPAFTLDMIYRAMPGGGEKAGPQQRREIFKAIEKFRRLHITIDATEEMRRRKIIGENETFVLDDFFLSASHAKLATKNGTQEVDAYKLNAEPIILTYSKLSGNQLLTVPAKYLAIEKTKINPKTKAPEASGELLAMTPERQAMTGYLLRRIKIMARDREKAQEELRAYNYRMQRDKTLKEKPLESFYKKSNVILFDTLFRETSTATDSRTQTSRNRDFCLSVLDFLTASGGLIKGYKLQTQGKKITGVQIDL